MAFDLTDHIINQERARRAGIIKIAAREINTCPDPGKRWKAVQELRKMQTDRQADSTGCR